MIDAAKKYRFVKARARGKSLRVTAEELEIGLQTAVRLERTLKEQIENLKAVELEALQETYWLTKQARLTLDSEEAEPAIHRPRCSCCASFWA